MIRRVRAGLRAIVRTKGRIKAGIGHDAEWPKCGENRPAIRPRSGNRWILVTLIEKMNAARTHVSDGQDGGLEDLPLNIEIPLHLIRRGRRIVIYGVALRRQRSHKRRSWECRENLNREAVWRIEVIPGRVGARRDGIVEDPKAATDRSLVVAKWIVSEAKARIEVSQRRIAQEYVRNSGERFCGPVVRNRIERVLVRGWIAHELITKSEVKSKVAPSFPIILKVAVKINLAKITVAVTLVRQRPEKQEGRSAQETCKAVEHVLSAQPAGCVHIGLHALDIRSEPEAVRSVSPINIVTAPVLVLNEKE